MPALLGIIASAGKNLETFVELGAGDAIYVADEAGFDFSGDVDLRMRIQVPDWDGVGSQPLIDKFGSDGNSSFRWRTVVGYPQFSFSSDGTYATIVDRGPANHYGEVLSDSVAYWVRMVLDADNGASGHDVMAYWSLTNGSWTQLGSTSTNAGVASIYAGTQDLTICSGMVGKLWAIQIRDSIDGSPVLDWSLERDGRYDSIYSDALTGQTLYFDGTPVFG